MTIYNEQEARELSTEDLMYLLNWSGYDERQLIDAEIRRRLDEWEKKVKEEV